ncbi:MAG: LysR family transcriptional regulator [Burkholderiales bacterium]|nr:LysR family transcriptional regulator [Burkholderiales bacterium]
MSRNLNDTLMFVKVVEMGSFTAAARMLGVPKATLSRKLQLLEQELGARLLKRTTRRLGLTEAGALYYDYCARIGRELAEAESAVNQLHGTPRGWLRFTAPYSLGSDAVAPLLPAFMALHPEVRVEMLLSSENLDLVATEMDLALRVGKLQDSTLAARRLGIIRSQTYASPRYLERYGEPLQPPDLEHHRTISLSIYRHANRYCWKLTQEAETAEVFVNPVFAVNDPSCINVALLNGLGIGLMPEPFAAPALIDGRLRRVLAPWSGPAFELNAVFPPGRMHAPKVRAFVDFLLSQLDLADLARPAHTSADA